NYQCNRLGAKFNFAIVQWTKGRTRRRNFVPEAGVKTRNLRPVFVREDLQNALERESFGAVDALDASFSKSTRDHHSVGEAGHIVFGSVFRLSRNFGATVNAALWLSDVSGGHDQ